MCRRGEARPLNVRRLSFGTRRDESAQCGLRRPHAWAPSHRRVLGDAGLHCVVIERGRVPRHRPLGSHAIEIDELFGELHHDLDHEVGGRFLSGMRSVHRHRPIGAHTDMLFRGRIRRCGADTWCRRGWTPRLIVSQRWCMDVERIRDLTRHGFAVDEGAGDDHHRWVLLGLGRACGDFQLQ